MPKDPSPPAAPAIHPARSLPPPEQAAAGMLRVAQPSFQIARSIAASAAGLVIALSSPGNAQALRDSIGTGKDAVGVALEMAKPAGRAGERIAAEAGAGARAIQALPRYMASVRQLTTDVGRIKVNLHKAGIAAEAGSDAARSAVVFMKPMLQAAEHAQIAETQLLRSFERAAELYGGTANSSLGKLALAAEKVLAASPTFRGLLDQGRLVATKGLPTALTSLGVATAAWETYETSPVQSKLGRVVHAGVAGAIVGGADVATGTFGAIFDPAIKYGLSAVGQKELGESLTLEKWSKGTSNVYAGWTRAALSQDSAPLDELHKQNMAGQNGRVLQGYAMIGEKVAEAMDPVYTKVADATYDLPRRIGRWASGVAEDITESLKWWGD